MFVLGFYSDVSFSAAPKGTGEDGAPSHPFRGAPSILSFERKEHALFGVAHHRLASRNSLVEEAKGERGNPLL